MENTHIKQFLWNPTRTSMSFRVKHAPSKTSTDPVSCYSCRLPSYPEVVAIKIINTRIHVWSTENAYKNVQAVKFLSRAMFYTANQADIFKTRWKSGEETITDHEGISGADVGGLIVNCLAFLKMNSDTVLRETGNGFDAFWFISDPTAKTKAAALSQGSALMVHTTGDKGCSTSLVVPISCQNPYIADFRLKIPVSMTSYIAAKR